MRRLKALLSLVALGAALGLAAGCVDSDEEAARTPEDAPTVQNTAVQTDEQGQTVTAPVTPPDGEPGPPPPEEQVPGDPAAGQQVFAASCTSCHLNDGQDAGGVGPQLAGQGLAEGLIRTTIVEGRGPMPGGLVSGDDLDNAVAYVLSIQ